MNVERLNILKKIRAERNKTISLSKEDIIEYSQRCKIPHKSLEIEDCLNTIFMGDAFEILNFIPDNLVDLLIVDPPYNLRKKYSDSTFNKMSNIDYRNFTENWISLLKPKLKKNASIYVCCDWKSSLVIGDVLSRHFIVQNRITWQREKGRGAKQNWKNAMEDIWFATVSKDYIFNVDNVKMRRKVMAPYKIDGKPKDWNETEDGNFRDVFPSNFWDDISIPYWSMPENTNHPTQKPEKLIAKLILANSNKGSVVLDPFIGSGTTAIVAKKLQRHFIGIEYEREYCALSQKRLEAADENKQIQGYTDGVFWERNTNLSQKKITRKKIEKSKSGFQN